MAPNHVSMNIGRGYVVPREEFQDGLEHQGYPLTNCYSGHTADPRLVHTRLSTQIPSHCSNFTASILYYTATLTMQLVPRTTTGLLASQP